VNKGLKILFVAGAILYFFHSGSVAQDGAMSVSRQKVLFLLNSLDTLINDYSNYSSFIQGSTYNYEDLRKFKSLFVSDSVLVFDDINPNILGGKEDVMKEKIKPLNQYTEEILSEFRSMKTDVIRTDVASAIERMYQQGDSIYFSVSVLKNTTAEYRDSTKSASINTSANLELWIRLYDTVQCDMKIAGISKLGPKGVTWNYILPDLKRKMMETHFSLKPSYSLFHPIESWLDQGSLVLLTDQYPVFNSELKERGIANNYFWGHYGMNADMEFRFFWRKEEKNKTKGFSFGVGGGIYNSFFQADAYSEVSQDETDMDNDYYHRITTVNDLFERWTMYSVDIPVKYSSERWKTYTKGRYFKLGARISYIGYGNGVARGSYSRSGYYPEYGVTMKDIPRYGFVSNVQLNEKLPLVLNPYNIALEMTLGKKRKSKSGNAVIYTGLNFGAYFDNFLMKESNDALFSFGYNKNGAPTSGYNGIFNMLDNGRLGYIGLVFGIRKADRNEFILKKKRLEYSGDYADYIKENYSRLKIAGIDQRNLKLEHTMLIDELTNKEKPLFSYHHNKPIANFNIYLKNTITLSRAERKRIRKEDDKTIQFSFVVDRNGTVRDVELKNQNDTEFGQELFRLVAQSSWTHGTLDGIPVNTRIEMTFKY
jgi:hypothetical protein